MLDRAVLYYDHSKKKTEMIRTKNRVMKKYESNHPSRLQIRLYGFKGNNRFGPGGIQLKNRIEVE